MNYNLGVLFFLVGSLTLPACDSDGVRGEPCKPFAATVPPLVGDVEAALSGKDVFFFSLKMEGTPKRRLFQQVEGDWRELVLRGSGIDDRPVKQELLAFFSFSDRKDRQAVLGYEMKSGKVTWSALAYTDQNAESKEEFENIKDRIDLVQMDGFALPEESEVQPIVENKDFHFYAEFEDNEKLLVVRPSKLAQSYGLYVGQRNELMGAHQLRIDKSKNGSLYFEFKHSLGKAFLSVPIDGKPSLQIGEKSVELRNTVFDDINLSFFDEISFFGCDRAHG